MVVFHCFVPGRVVPQARPKVTRTGHAYTPRDSSECRDRLKKAFENVQHSAPVDCPVLVSTRVLVGRPRDKKGELTEAGKRPFPVHPTAGDVDNLFKQVTDALQGAGIIKDDRYIVTAISQKIWAPSEGTVGVIVTVETIGQQED